MNNYLEDLAQSLRHWRDSAITTDTLINRALPLIVELLGQHDIAAGPVMREMDARLKALEAAAELPKELRARVYALKERVDALESNFRALGGNWEATDLRSRTTVTDVSIINDNIEDFGARIEFLEKRVVWLAERADLTPEEWDFIDRSGQRDECERMVRQGKQPDEIRAALSEDADGQSSETSGEILSRVADALSNAMPTMAEAAENLREFREALNAPRKPEQAYVVIPAARFVRLQRAFEAIALRMVSGENVRPNAILAQITALLALLDDEGEVQS
jgi:hypothetical protein